MSTRNESDKAINRNNNKEEEEDDDDEDDEDYVPNTNVNDSEDEVPDLQDDEKLSDDEDSPTKSKKVKLNEIPTETNDLKSKKTEDLWSDFLSDVKTTSNTTKPDESSKPKPNTQPIVNKPKISPATIVTNKPKGGIASILNKLNKEPKLSTLEKSRLDWDEFKKNENLEEDLTKHSKGKESYLEKRAFLERADYREYEIEKGLRTKERKLRETH